MDSTTVVTHGDLFSLERETKQLLESIKPNKKPRAVVGQKQMSQSQTLPSSKSRKMKNRRSSRQLVPFAFDGSGPADKTLDLYKMKMSNNKVTVEVLDVDSPDNSPRQKFTKKQLAMMEETEFKLEDQRRIRTAELKFRNQDFKVEHIRILSKADIFVPGPGVTYDDMVHEKSRLIQLELSARRMSQIKLEETNTQLEVLQQHRAATFVQAIFRGYVGRKKFMLIRRLKDLSESDSDWIEVRDKASGDTWYYNKFSGISQWERPLEMQDRVASRGNVKRLPHHADGFSKSQRLSPLKTTRELHAVTPTKAGLSAVKYAADQIEKTLQREAEEALVEEQATKEVDGILGLKYLNPDENLIAPDGTFKRPQLRETIKDALTESRFDSVSSLIADLNWSGDAEAPQARTRSLPRAKTMPSMRRSDPTRKAFVSIIQPKKRLNKTVELKVLGDPDSTRDLTMREVDHPGFETAEEGVNGGATMCFGCWSAGHKKSCSMHADGEKKKMSETMLLCRNWELAVLRRRYRSEEIQEIFLQRAASLKYDIKRKKFLTVVEQRHPVYRTLNQLISRCNAKSMLWMKVVHWANSLVDLMHSGHINTPKAVALGEHMRTRKNERNFRTIGAYQRKVRSRFPLAPITGYSWAERTGAETYLFKHIDALIESEVDIIQIFPYPVPEKLYEPREYSLPLPKTIPMPRAESIPLEGAKPVGIRNTFMQESNPAAWLEIMAKSVTHDAISFASSQIKAITPIAGLEALRRIKEPPVTTIKFATLGRKPRPNMKDVGGLPAELLVSQMITTYVPPQYGSLVVIEKTSVGPGHSPEVSISFASLVVDPVTQQYILRPVDHILNYRKSPTIAISTEKGIDEKYYYGLNRPAQTGEHESKGFRTTETTLALPIPVITNPQNFIPANEVVSLNDPRANRAVTTKVDGLYPFCEPSTRDNSTLDFYHLLLNGSCSTSKPQVFTAISVQEPGQFLQDMRVDLPLGHLLVSVYRSWAFTQKDIYEEFKSDDGIPYWYHRKTGQTFWERPLHEEERGSPLTGASKIDEVHKEEPVVAHAAVEGAMRRVDQGLFRKQILTKHENLEEATKRRKSAAHSLNNARANGTPLPSVPPLQLESVTGAKVAAEDTNRFEVGAPAANETKKVRFPDEAQTGQMPENAAPTAAPGSDVVVLQPQQDMLLTITQSIEQMVSMNMFDKASPQDMIKLGLGMGMALLQNQSVTKVAETQGTPEKKQIQQTSFFPSIAEGESPPEPSAQGKFPIGAPSAQVKYSLNAGLEHEEEITTQQATMDSAGKRLTALESAQEVRVYEVITPATRLVEDLEPANADDEVKKDFPVLVYPELSTVIPGGAPSEVVLHTSAGVGDSYSKSGDDRSQFVQGTDVKLRRTALPLPNGFYDAIVSKRIAKQGASYLPQVPNLPQTHTVGRVKPRSAAGDWLILGFDPWSAGKPPLSSAFISNLATQAGKLFEGGQDQVERELETMRNEVTKDSYIAIEDKDGIEQIRAVTSKAHVLAADFKKLCSLARHGKFDEVENLMNQSDWEVPINYTDEQGRTLLHIVSQNGNKRLVKLCLRRGININVQTLTGQTALHYAFGFGFAALGEYLISKGADDSIRNTDGLTCYEGLESMHVSYL